MSIHTGKAILKKKPFQNISNNTHFMSVKIYNF